MDEDFMTALLSSDKHFYSNIFDKFDIFDFLDFIMPLSSQVFPFPFYLASSLQLMFGLCHADPIKNCDNKLVW